MATKPTKFPRWATSATDPEGIHEPSEAKKDSGWIAELPPFQWMNWLFNLIYQWTEYLDYMVTLAKNTIKITSWFEKENPKAFTLNDVVQFTPGSSNILVAVGAADGTDAYLAYSTNRGNSWTEAANDENLTLNAVGAGQDPTAPTTDMLVSVGNDGYIVTSSNGSSWSKTSSGSGFALNGIAYSASLNQWVAVGVADGTDAEIFTLGATGGWTERANPKNITLNNAVWCEELGLWVVVGNGDGVDAYILTSPDGVTWTERSNPKNLHLYSVVWAEELGLLVAVGMTEGGGDAYIITSPDAVTWTERSNPREIGLNSVVWDGSLFVSVGNSSGTKPYIVTSTDGKYWVERDLYNPQDLDLNSVCCEITESPEFGGVSSFFVAVGEADGTDAYILKSIVI